MSGRTPGPALLLELYWGQGLSQRGVADRLGIERWRIAAAMKKHNIKRRPPRTLPTALGAPYIPDDATSYSLGGATAEHIKRNCRELVATSKFVRTHKPGVTTGRPACRYCCPRRKPEES